jgi:hypothetical protein
MAFHGMSFAKDIGEFEGLVACPCADRYEVTLAVSRSTGDPLGEDWQVFCSGTRSRQQAIPVGNKAVPLSAS